jgi:two-component system, chemotaxis family, protein-glutamate methylesterase/glutaminase
MSIVVAAVTPASRADGGPLRVMVVDDAVVVRGLVSRWVDGEPDMKVVASLRTGREAVDQVERVNPDVVVLDVDMPVLDGISALPLLLEKKRDLVVIMASTLTRRNAEVSLKALSLGATDYIPKPETNREVTTSATFRRELIEKIRQLGTRRRRGAASLRGPAPALVPAVPARAAAVPARADNVRRLREGADADIKLRPFSLTPPRVLLIGSSTGGPQALTALAAQLNGVIDTAPVLITQHMPPTFTTILAEHLARASGRPAREPEHGERVLAGNIYLAPGGRHMRVIRRDGVPVIALDEGPLVNFCRPAVDPLFSSAASIWGTWNLALILTGMGSDGTRGAADIVAAGGNVIAQDEPTSVVWGMPGSAAHAGVCSAVLPLDQIAPKIVRLFTGDRS